MLVHRFDPFKNFFPSPYYIPEYKDDENQDAMMAFKPLTNTREGEFAYHIEIDLPGLSKKDIKIDIKDKMLIVYGERKLKKEIKEDDYYKVETQIGKFQRQFTLPKDIDIENISANSQDGILEIVIPKLEEKTTKKSIEIK